jgi:exopolysaccharide biosynthesis polyprenyl glycosylphosphotransferase
VKPRGRFAGRSFLMMAGDSAVAVAVFAAVVWTRRLVPLPGTKGRLPEYNLSLALFPWLVAVGVAALVALVLAGTYDEPAASVRERGGLLVSSLLAAGFLVGFYFFVGHPVPRTVLVTYVPLLWVGLELWRALAERLMPIGIRPVLVLGSGEDARRAAEALESGLITGHSLYEWRRDLSVFRETSSGETDVTSIPAGGFDVVFASEKPEDRLTLVALLERTLEHDFELWILPGLSDIVASRAVTRSLADLPLTPVATRGASAPAFFLRRAIDLTLGLALLVLALPLLLAASAAVALGSPGDPWIRQRRVGRGGKLFDLWKIRTMRQDAEEGIGPTLAKKDDDRLTRVGRWLRKARLDELPQLLHVVGGTMSLIGPRPERPAFVEAFTKEVPAYRLRHVLKPGLTGLAQVMGAYATKPDVKLRYDLGYLFHWSPFLDLFILLRTVVTVLRGSGV